MPPRKKLAARPKCTPCGGLAIFPDKLAAEFQGTFWNMRAYPCPYRRNRWHLTSTPLEDPS